MRRACVTILVAAMCSSIAVIAQQAQVLYQQGLSQENAAGDLAKAVALYRRAAEAAGADRALAARALVRAAAAFERLGRQADAADLYADVVRRYPEQRIEAGL